VGAVLATELIMADLLLEVRSADCRVRRIRWWRGRLARWWAAGAL